MEEPNAELVEKPDSLQEKTLQAAYDFARTVKSDVDPMLSGDLNVKICRSLTLASAKMLESIGHSPVIKVRINKFGNVYHYFLEDPELDIAIDYQPIAHQAGFVEDGAVLSDSLEKVIAREIFVLPLDSDEYKEISGVGRVEVRKEGRTAIDQKNFTRVAWSQVNLGKMPDTIREKLEALK